MSELLGQVKQLDLTNDQFLVVGSGILNVLGIRPSRDLDIIVTKVCFDEIASRTGRLGQHQDGTRTLYVGDIEIMDDWFGEDFASLEPRTVDIDGVKYLSLDDVVEYKKKLGRDKDLVDLEMVRLYLEKHTDSTT